MFITFYGINNIGKTYHARRLTQRLNDAGRKAIYIKYPIYDLAPSGPYLNKILREHGQNMSEQELQLWFVLNRYQFQPQLKEFLQKGFVVVAEDYIGTGIAWGMAKSKIPARMQRHLELMNKYLVQPDVAILLDGKRQKKSREAGHIHESDEKLLARCQRIFKKLAQKYHWKKVITHEDKDVTAARIWRVIMSP